MAHNEVIPVYIIHWNAPEWCASAARSILRSEGVRVELTVIDNGQEDGPPLEESLPSDVRLLRLAQNLGYAGGANLALADWRSRLPESDVCVIGSHDLHLQADALKKLVAAASLERSYGILAPALISPYQFSGGYWTGWREGPVPLASVQGLAERDWVPGSCMLLRRECVESIGGFDETFGSYVEDVDFSLRAKDAGWKVGVLAEALHWGLGSASRYAGPMMAANRVVLIAKRRGQAMGTLRSITTMSYLGFRTLGAFLGIVISRTDAEARSDSKESVSAYLRALRRTMVLLIGLWRDSSRAGEEPKKAYEEVTLSGCQRGERVGDDGSIESKEPLASIVITTCDRPASVRRAVSSALMQTIRNIEIVVVDSGSVTAYRSPGDKRVRVIRVEGPLGESSARNRGLNEARSDWITFLDDADELLPHMVETSLRAAAESRLPSPVAVLSVIEVVESTGRIVDMLIPGTQPRGHLLPSPTGGARIRPTNTLMAPVNLLRSIGGWDEEISAWVHDDLFLRLSMVCSIEGINQVTYRMAADRDGRVIEDHMARAQGIGRTLAKHRDAFRGHQRARARYLAEMGKSYLKAGAWFPAVAASTRALLGDPQRPYALRQWLGTLAGPHAWSWYIRMRRAPAARP